MSMMMNEAPALCGALLDKRDDHRGFALCSREIEHGGVHYGAAPDSTSWQWTSDESYVHPPTRDDELSLWGGALPAIGEQLTITLSSGQQRLGVFAGALFDDSGPRALVFTHAADETQRHTIPWHAVVELVVSAS